MNTTPKKRKRARHAPTRTLPSTPIATAFAEGYSKLRVAKKLDVCDFIELAAFLSKFEREHRFEKLLGESS